jgi:hypothetical protein
MDPAKLREMLPTDQFDIYMNISGAPETSDTELKSLIIVRK